MGRNNYNEGGDDFGDLYGKELDVLADENREAQVASYKNVNVDATASKIKDNAIKYIKNIVGIYHKADKKVDDFYISELEKTEQDEQFESVIASIAEIESMNLVMLLKQVKWADHLVETLMRRLESGGNMDSELISNIMAAQSSSLNLTLTISSYVRNIPTYFKHLKNDLSEGSTNQSDMLIADSSGMLKLEQITQGHTMTDSEVSEFDIAKPQRGMKDLINRVNKAKQEAAGISNDNNTIDYEEIKN